MTRKIATVSETTHYGKNGCWYELVLDCAQTQGRWIPLDSPQWFAWLEAPENNGFSYALHNHTKGYIDGFMTVRKERRQRGGAYWSAYRRQGRRLRKIYLGSSASLTAARLREVAARLYIHEDTVAADSTQAPTATTTTTATATAPERRKNLLSP